MHKWEFAMTGVEPAGKSDRKSAEPTSGICSRRADPLSQYPQNTIRSFRPTSPAIQTTPILLLIERIVPTHIGTHVTAKAAMRPVADPASSDRL